MSKKIERTFGSKCQSGSGSRSRDSRKCGSGSRNFKNADPDPKPWRKCSYEFSITFLNRWLSMHFFSFCGYIYFLLEKNPISDLELNWLNQASRCIDYIFLYCTIQYNLCKLNFGLIKFIIAFIFINERIPLQKTIVKVSIPGRF